MKGEQGGEGAQLISTVSEKGHTDASIGFLARTAVYSGPLDLLIDLIEKRKLLVNDISLATVTDDYMRYVAALQEKNLRETADFIVFASTLLLLKSKSLLPVLELTDAEEESVEALETRLRHYQIYRNAGRILESRFGSRMNVERPFTSRIRIQFMSDRYTTGEVLKSAIFSVLSALPKKTETPKVRVKKVVSLEEMYARLRARVERQISFKFNEFAGAERENVIVGFLAVLEMVKQGVVLVRQSGRCVDFEIERGVEGAPRYF